MTRVYKNNSRNYSDIKSELHRAKDKISFLSTDIERLEEENATLRANLAEAAPMYPAHYHEEKHAAFVLGKETIKKRNIPLLVAGMAIAWLAMVIIDVVKLLLK